MTMNEFEVVTVIDRPVDKVFAAPRRSPPAEVR
jgi:hypothetical protein